MKLITVFFIMLLAFACRESSSITGPVKSGSYNYQSFDTLGNLLASGSMIIAQIDSVHLKGSWQLIKVQNRQDIGPQQGYGSLYGTLSDSMVVIDLNPDFRDNNVILTGTVNGKRIDGKWAWISFIGETNWGRFAAVKD